MAILFGQYAAIKTNAVTANLLTVNNQQFYDVVGRSQLPYQQKNLFAAAPTEKYYTNTVTFKYSTTAYFSNTSATHSYRTLGGF